MRYIKNKICTDCELIALIEGDNIWLRYIKSHQATLPTGDLVTGGRPVVNPPQNEHEPMHIIYRMCSLLDDPEDIYRLANVLSEHSSFETILRHLDSIDDMSSGKALLQILLILFEFAFKLKVNQQQQRRDQKLLSLTEKLIFIMDQLFHEAKFDRLDLEQTSSSLTSSDNDSQFCDLVNDSNGIIDQCIDYIEINSPPVKTYLASSATVSKIFKVLAMYTCTKKVDIESFEAKTRKTPDYATVIHL
ncbi:unnamed protein product, partial [Rotaria sp. Silwood1]